MLNASSFVKNRSTAIALTNSRILSILWYVAECYIILQKYAPSYSKSAKTTLKFEDYLKFKFINDYLVPNKSILQNRVSALEEITFSGETQKIYKDSKDRKEKPDKIDIYINKLGLQQEWGEPDEHVYFAIECKRITGTKSYSEYVVDIQKMTERNHTNLRLPFEGMIGFVEDSKITHAIASAEVSKRLKATKKIVTQKYLAPIALNSSFNASYSSSHKKSFGGKSAFTVYHLFLDYSKNVVS